MLRALFINERRSVYGLTTGHANGQHAIPEGHVEWEETFNYSDATLIYADCFAWLNEQEDTSIPAVVNDPLYGLKEYMPEEHPKLGNRPWRGLEDTLGVRRPHLDPIATFHDSN